jgi:hypothetical protein
MTTPLRARPLVDGTFPFGRSNEPQTCRPAESGDARQVIIGTYPSALHVGWAAPAYVRLPPGATGRVASLAVAPEPAVFWDGADADERVRAWAEEVGFVEGDEPGCHGTLRRATNGPTGTTLLDAYLPGLPHCYEHTAFMDVYPVFMVKHGTSTRRGQADVMVSEYGAVVDQLAPSARRRARRFEPGTLPVRPSARELPFLAARRFGLSLAETLMTLRPEHVVTLGEEAWRTLEYIGLITRHPCYSLQETRTRGYGQTGQISVMGQRMAWTPLAHPGALRQSRGRAGGWAAVHDDWLARAR